MSTQTDALAAFRASLSEIGVGYTRTDAEGFDEALAAAVDDRSATVGAPLSVPAGGDDRGGGDRDAGGRGADDRGAGNRDAGGRGGGARGGGADGGDGDGVRSGTGDGAGLPALPSWVETDPTAAELRAAGTGVTPARFAVAELGTVAVPSTPGGAEPLSLYPERHVAVVAAADVVPDVPAAMGRLAGAVADGDSLVFATGASATADMGELVEGVHGPSEVHVIVVGADGGAGVDGDGRAAPAGDAAGDGPASANGATPSGTGDGSRADDGTGGADTAVPGGEVTNGTAPPESDGTGPGSPDGTPGAEGGGERR